MTIATWAVFLLAAALGAAARYLVDGFVQDRARGAFPWGTLVVNVSGCLVLGFLTGLALYHDLDPAWRTVLGTGALGAYTTFSTFTFETIRLVEEGAVTDAVRNVTANFFVGLAAVAAGLAVAALA